MVTTFTKTVGATSRDYSTIALAEADILNIVGSGDLVTDDEELIFELYDDGDFVETVTFVQVGLTTGVDNTVTFKAASGEQHNGVRGDGVKVLPTTTGITFNVWIHHLHIEGLQVVTGSAASDECIRIRPTFTGVVIENCIFEGEGTSEQDGIYAGNFAVGSSSYPILVRNCLFHGFTRAGIHSQNFSSGTPYDQYWDVVNCTFVDCTRGIGWRATNASSTTYMPIINCIGGNNSTDDIGKTAASSGTLDSTGSSDNFGEDTGTVLDGQFPDNTAITLTDSTSPGAGSWCILEDVTGTDFTDWDLRMVDDTDNDAQDAGVGPSSESLVAEYDAVGNARAGTTTDPGYYQVTAVATSRRIFVTS